MSYPTVPRLAEKWNIFENQIALIANLKQDYLADIKKLMTAISVIDQSSHTIYAHAEYVHQLTQKIQALKAAQPLDEHVNACYQLWLSILTLRNQTPLKIKHPKKLDGECDFRFSLQIMAGKQHGFKEIHQLNPNDPSEIEQVMNAIHRLESLAFGISYGHLPLVDNTVLAAILAAKNTVCLLAKDQTNQIIGYCWGMLLTNLTVAKEQKANVFWVMDLARDPDFYDTQVKVGDQLRAKMVEVIKAHNYCDFVGYQHLIKHPFHMNIVSLGEKNQESIQINNESFSAKTAIKFEDTIKGYMRSHYIKTHDHDYAYPSANIVKRAIFSALWQAAHSTKDFLFGGAAMYGRIYYQKLTHSLANDPIEERLIPNIQPEEQEIALRILKEIILTNTWAEQGKSIFSGSHVPKTMQTLQNYAKCEETPFLRIKSCVLQSGTNLARSKLTRLFYKTIAAAETPTMVIEQLLAANPIPSKWVDIISSHYKPVIDTSFKINRR